MKKESRQLLDKAATSIRAAETLLEEEFLEVAVGRAYYAMFYIAEALLREKGFRKFKRHTAVQAMFGKTFSKTKELDPNFHSRLDRLFEIALALSITAE